MQMYSTDSLVFVSPYNNKLTQFPFCISAFDTILLAFSSVEESFLEKILGSRGDHLEREIPGTDQHMCRAIHGR